MFLVEMRFTCCLLFLSALVFAKLNATQTQINKAKPSIIIVGAGISGLAAATRLIDYGFKDIKILEAENRIGGRVYSIKTGNWTVDYGAHWIPGQKGNPVFDLAEPLGLLKKVNDFCSDDIKIFSDNKELTINISEVSYNLHEIRNNITYLSNSNESFHTVLSKSIKPILRNLLNDDGKENAYISWLSKKICTEEGCDTLSDVSAKGQVCSEGGGSGNVVGWNGKGYGTIVDLLLRRHEKSKGSPINLKQMLYLNKEVEKISIKDRGVSVMCKDGSVFTSDIAIVTVSLGVLKDRYKTLFHPHLPNYKVNAIENLGIGTINKIFLRFPNIWWPSYCGPLKTLWVEGDKVLENGQFPWEVETFMFCPEDGSPYTLTSWLVGDAARSMELNSIEQVKEGHMRVLKKFFGHKYTIPEPVEVIRSKWGTNPHFRGSYSYRSMASEKMNVSAADLEQPVKNSLGEEVLFFAGEGTHRTYYSTAYGALDSGWREASRIMKIFS